jgi:hypothetical protein
MRFVFDLGLWYGPNDIEHHIFTVSDPDITDSGQALWLCVDWAMEVGRKLNADKQKAGSWPAHSRRPKNVTTYKLLED